MRRVRLLTACVAAASVVVAVPGTAADLGGRSASAIGATGASDPARWVNPFVGTDASAANYGTGGGAGNTYPGATVPFGMVQWSPDTAQQDVSYVGGYGWHDTHIRGFGLTHMSGAGCAIYGDIPFLPTTAPITASPAKPFSADLATQFQPAFSHQHEAASPGYYSVVLNPGTTRAITTELSATTRTGAARLTFPGTRSASVLINAGGSAMADSAAAVQIDASHREVTGSASSGRFCYQQGGDYTVYFAAVFDRPFTSHGTWQRQTLHAGGTDDSDTSVFWLANDHFGSQPDCS